MTRFRHRYLIFGQPRGLLADALLEYRQFAAENPEDEYAGELLDVADQVHLALHEERELLRQLGERRKPNGDCGQVDAADRGRRRRARRARVASRAAAA